MEEVLARAGRMALPVRRFRPSDAKRWRARCSARSSHRGDPGETFVWPAEAGNGVPAVETLARQRAGHDGVTGRVAEDDEDSRRGRWSAVARRRLWRQWHLPPRAPARMSGCCQRPVRGLGLFDVLNQKFVS
jgi:hypothetical protein